MSIASGGMSVVSNVVYANLIFLATYFLLAAGISFLIAPVYIRFLIRYRLGKNIRTQATIGPATEFHKLHAHKQGTPTFGGGMILLVVVALIVVSVVALWLAPEIKNIAGFTIKYSLWNRNETYLAVFTLITTGIIGAVDDYISVRQIGGKKWWLSERIKTAFLLLFSVLGAYWFYVRLGRDIISIPGFDSLSIGAWYPVVFVFVFMAMANSVNITDGLDGLAGFLLLLNYSLYAYITFDKWLLILSALCVIIAGSLMGFLWFNIKPAKFYMGDMGSLSLGATLAVIAMMTDTLGVLLVISGIYLLEIMSVIIQLTSKRFRNGKKVFRIAPIHHHFEAIGIPEETVVMRFWLSAIMLHALGVIAYLLIR
jgi:phospho-N-acetylmuramoyl-pentapeptide-transferase